MLNRTSVYRFISVFQEPVFWDYEKINWTSVESQLYGLYTFVGIGIVNGWDVLSVTQAEVNALSPEVKASLAHLDWCMIIRITAGDGVIGVYPAYTPEDEYFALPLMNLSRLYYVYAVGTDCLPTKYRANILVTTDSDYDSSHDAVYLATVTVFYDTDTNELYISRIQDQNRRRILKNLEGLLSGVEKEKFYRHVHIGQPTTVFQPAIEDNPTKITLDSEVVENLPVVASSPIFLLSPFTLPADGGTPGKAIKAISLPHYEKADVKLNGVILSINDYFLDNLGGKLYLKNSISAEDIVQIVKYMDPVDGQIARGPQDDPPSQLIGGNVVVVTGDDRFLVDDRYKLPSNRVGDIDGSKIVFGTFSSSQIEPLDHFGLNRVKEAANFRPSITTRSKDQRTYYLVPPDITIGYDTEVFEVHNSFVLGNVVSIASGLYKVNDTDYQSLTKLGFPDDFGHVIKIYDNCVEGEHGGQIQFPEAYALTDQGKVWYTQDSGVTWTELVVPTAVSFVNDFTVSTDKVERIVKNQLTHDYYKVYHLATSIGLFTARFLAAAGTLTGGTTPVIVTTIPWQLDPSQAGVEIYSLQEIITGHSFVADSGSSYWYDRTLYLGTENGFYAGDRLVSAAIIADDIMWLYENNGILVLSEEKVYVSHTAKQITIVTAESTEVYWKHDLTETGEELHASYDFTTFGYTPNRLSQEPGRRKYLIGLNDSVAISSTDLQTRFAANQPFLFGSLTVVDSLYGIKSLSAVLTTTGCNCSISTLQGKINVISLANAANQAARSDAAKEIADGWQPLSWSIPSTYIDDAQTVNFSAQAFMGFDPGFGYKSQGTDYYSASHNGIWKSTDGGLNWDRTVKIWNVETIPYIEKNGIEILPSLGGYSLNPAMQAIIFTTQQKTSDIILLEKDFIDYYAVNGPWEQANADVAVYVDNSLTTIPYTYDMAQGKFIFSQALTKTANVIFSVLHPGTYITDIGEIPHSEILDAFIPSTTVKTELTTDLIGGMDTIKVGSTNDFPAQVFYIQIEDERIYVQKIDKYTFKSLKTRSDIIHAEGKEVVWLEVKRQYGIEDYLSLYMNEQPYDLYSLYVSNLLRGQLSSRRVYVNIYDDPPHYPPVSLGSDVEQGLYQTLLHIGGTDPMDEGDSTSTLWNGLDIPSRIAVATPKIVSTMLSPATSSFLAGSERGVWKYDGIKWKQLSSLGDAGFISYLNYAKRTGYLLAGANNGLWISTDDGVTWAPSSTFYQQQLSYLDGSLTWWGAIARPYELYGKNDGMSMVVYGWDEGVPESFHSDHFDSVDGKRVYGFYQGIFYRVDGETGQRTTYQSIWIMSEVGVWVCYSGTRTYSDGSTNPYSSLLNGTEPVDSGVRTTRTTDSTTGEVKTTVTSGTVGDLSKDQRYIKVGLDALSQPIYEKLKFYGAFQDARPKTIPLIFLTNDGLRVARNWRWIDPVNPGLYLSFEASPLSINNDDILTNTDNSRRVTCNCFATGTDTTILDTSPNVWKKYKCFIGTNKGIYRSYNGCYTVEPAQNIDGVPEIYQLIYSNDTLYAGTNNGWWYSVDEGDSWIQPTININNASYVDSATVTSESRCLLTCNKAKVGSGGVVDFPTLVSGINMPADFWATVQSDGRDLRFTADDGITVLNHELVSINTSAQTLESWVKCPSLLSATDVKIYAYWGDSTAVMPTPAFQQATWSNGFVSGWHMNGTSSPFSDMTATANAISAFGDVPNEVPGQIGNGQSFDGSGDYFLSNGTDPPVGAFTVSAWVKPDSFNGFIFMFANAYGGGTFDRGFILDWTGKYSFYAYNGSSFFATATSSPTNYWTYLVGTIDTVTGGSLYVDGLIAGPTNPLITDGYNGYSGGAKALIGGQAWAGWGISDFDGLIDEVRYSSVTRSPEWILTEYNNQFSPSTFWSTGTTEIIGGSGHTHDSSIDLSVAQTFMSDYNEITKVGLYLHIKG